MKKLTVFCSAVILSIAVLTGCNSTPVDPGTPPSDVIDPGISEGNSNSAGNITNSASGIGTGGNSHVSQGTNGGQQGADNAEVLENAVSVRIGNDGKKDWYINMYDNAASRTMLGYLSSSELRFPTYNYDDEHGFVSQSVRGSYTRDNEITIENVKAGELYLFSGGQLRFYYRDSAGVNITATPIGYYVETDGLADAVTYAYTSNLGDSWSVDVYFNIRKRI